MTKGHAFVLGSGVAGLSLAEMLSRNGWRITLLEASADLGGDASRSTQNWLHTGWLYAALPNAAAMLGCHQALRLFHPMYGPVVSPHALNLELGEWGVRYPASAEGWFSSERVHYLYAKQTSELSDAQRVRWQRLLESLAFPRLRALGYDTNPTTTISPNLSALLDAWEGGADGHTKYSVVRSTDAQIITRRVLDSLLSLLGDKAEVVRNAKYSLVRRGQRSVIQMDGEHHCPDLVVMATGKGIPEQLTALGADAMAANFKSVCSPVVVLNRALELPNFIRFTSQLPQTINHIKYEIRGLGQRSTIGSYDYYPAGDAPDISPFVNKVCRRLGVSLSDVAKVYYGTKTEYAGSLARRYNHAFERVNDNSCFAIPGKFSQFPLLVHEFARHYGLRTDIGNDSRGQLPLRVSATLPEQGVLERQRGLGLVTA